MHSTRLACANSKKRFRKCHRRSLAKDWVKPLCVDSKRKPKAYGKKREFTVVSSASRTIETVKRAVALWWSRNQRVVFYRCLLALLFWILRKNLQKLKRSHSILSSLYFIKEALPIQSSQQGSPMSLFSQGCLFHFLPLLLLITSAPLPSIAGITSRDEVMKEVCLF